MTDNLKQDTAKFFRRLGSVVESRWRDKNYDDTVFPQIAAAALTEHSPYGQVDPWEIIRNLASDQALPAQMDPPASFGNPPITLFVGPRFYIDIYFWLDGTTAVHQHSFAGAFQVLLGSSIHSHYAFTPEHKINPEFSLGKLRLLEVQLLEEGAIKQIKPGQDYIHSLFHLDRPSATIAVRTYKVPHAEPQWSYLKPSVAYDPFFKEPIMMKKIQSVNLLYSMKHPETDAIVGEMLRSSDFQTAFLILDAVHRHLGVNELERMFGVTTGNDRFQGLLAKMRERHGDLADSLPLVFAEQRRQVDIASRRGLITEGEHRFFLALLLNVPGREQIINLVQKRFPAESPVEKIMNWIEELAAIRQIGSEESSVLGIEGFDDVHLALLEYMLEGKSVDQAIRELVKGAAQSAGDDLAVRIRATHAKLLKAQIFSSLFDESAANAAGH